VDHDDFDLLSRGDSPHTYSFDTRIAVHPSCTKCGIHPLYRPCSPPAAGHKYSLPRPRRDGGVRSRTTRRQRARSGGHRWIEVVLPRYEHRYIWPCERGIYDVRAERVSRGRFRERRWIASFRRLQGEILLASGDRMATSSGDTGTCDTKS
jgi:hypothetical protein